MDPNNIIASPRDPKFFDVTGAQFSWNSTSIKLAEECLYKYNLKVLQGWAPNNKNVHLKFGGWYASALESFHHYVAKGMDREEAIIEVITTLMEETWEYEYDDNDQVIPESGTPWQSDHNTKTRENLIRTVVWYLDQFKDDPTATVILSDGSPAVEHTFLLPADDGIVFSGHLDRLVTYTGKIFVQDQKTTGSTITPRYFEGFSPDTQMSLYTFAGKAIFNEPVKGVIIDAAQIAVGFTRFERGFTFRSDDQLDEWYDHTLAHIGRARRATLDNHFPMTRTSCSNYGGCEFHHICSRAPSVREQFLKADFVKGKAWL